MIKSKRNFGLFVVLSLGFAGMAQAQGVTTGTYAATMTGGCATLVLTGAGPTGNSYIWDEGCDGRADYNANSVRVTSRGISVDSARISKIVTDPKGFTGDWSLGGTTFKGVIFTRQ